MEREYLQTLFILSKLIEKRNDNYINSYKFFKNEKKKIEYQINKLKKEKKLKSSIECIIFLFSNYMSIESLFYNVEKDLIDPLKKKLHKDLKS